jgi:hypothetical protein
MNPTAPHYRNHETLSHSDRIERCMSDAKLLRILHSQTKLKNPPSQHLRAWRAHERATIFAEGHQQSPKKMGYHLWMDSTRTLRDAHLLLTGDVARSKFETRRGPKAFPRMAMQWVAYAIGFRYLRGLEVVAGALAQNQHLTKFKLERLEFRNEFELSADAAHAINDKGQNPGAALEVVLMFQRELLSLCPWLELVGNTLDAGLLREACDLEPQRPDLSA